MIKHECIGQMALDLFSRPHEDRIDRFIERHKNWLRIVKKCEDQALFELFDELVDELGLTEAIERSKVFDLVSVYGFTIGELESIVCVSSEADYHVCWDRAWAYKMGMSKSLITTVRKWDYKCGKEHTAMKNGLTRI